MRNQEPIRIIRSIAALVSVAVTGYICLATSPCEERTQETASASVHFAAGQRSAFLRVAAEGSWASMRIEGPVTVQVLAPQVDAGDVAGSAPHCPPEQPGSTLDAATTVSVTCVSLHVSGEPVDYELVRADADEAVTIHVTAAAGAVWTHGESGPNVGISLSDLGPP